ncbi:Interferon-induced GTP-binding protein Mx [Lachnellula hyalina]|uniref:Interferon-induced GTP-binding protein Mx n=1 Tax=Lachnellula hyalina TaxID=1316788 RepID=A0A8H8R7W4_9HELO|nr:Interferon-induced GTP-binding protein Mx [Lachnellula hyalina]TVY29241.1 Interferon-induced GTP-binding protein Mx [Lachnellula hyalina]
MADSVSPRESSSLPSGSITPIDSPTGPVQDIALNTSLSNLESKDQRVVLDLITQLRKCGLSGDISLPQMVVCGQQSSGKSSLLEALTEVPFPTHDDVCTRYATVIHIRKADTKSLSIKIIPGDNRSGDEKAMIVAFEKSIASFGELPGVMEEAMGVMGIKKLQKSGRIFAEDVLSIEVEGPDRPQLTVVDIPGLIATATGGATDEDVALVDAITDRYISEPRTICLAVVAGGSHHATQTILEKVKKVDPKGDRTLGIITKPDRIDGEGSQRAFLELAQNLDIHLKLGWHIIKNRENTEGDYTLEQRKESEAKWISGSVFNILPSDHLGIDALIKRLSRVLFEHIRRELPKLKAEVEGKLETFEQTSKLMGKSRSTPQQCRTFLTEMSMRYYQTCKAAVDGHYEGGYFHQGVEYTSNETTISPRIRAVIQSLNIEFETAIRKHGHKYHIANMATHEPDSNNRYYENEENNSTSTGLEDGEGSYRENKSGNPDSIFDFQWPRAPETMNKADALVWVQMKMKSTRGKELVGNFNPLLIGELFWEQSSRWHKFAAAHVERVASICADFLKNLLKAECPSDMQDQVWDIIEDALKLRREAADEELAKIKEDLEDHPINYNHYYTDTITKLHREEQEKLLTEAIENATSYNKKFMNANVDISQAVASFSKRSNVDMESYASEEVLMSLMSLYKVKQKVFIDVITVQVIERHIIRSLENIFSPLIISDMADEEALSVAGEAVEVRDERARLSVMIGKLREGRAAFGKLVGGRLR